MAIPEEIAAEGEQAMALLKKAVEMGYRSPWLFRSETALDPLRNRDDFKRLMAELEAKSSAQLELLPTPREKK